MTNTQSQHLYLLWPNPQCTAALLPLASFPSIFPIKFLTSQLSTSPYIPPPPHHPLRSDQADTDCTEMAESWRLTPHSTCCLCPPSSNSVSLSFHVSFPTLHLNKKRALLLKLVIWAGWRLRCNLTTGSPIHHTDNVHTPLPCITCRRVCVHLWRWRVWARGSK